MSNNKKQKINCNVKSCEFNNETSKLCELDEINVAACPGQNNGKAQDESMCDSYKNKKHRK